MSKNNLQQYIAFDIDSNSIAVMVIQKKGSTNRVIYSERQGINHEKDLSFDEFFLKTQRILETLAQKTFLKLSGDDFAVYCNMSAPWVSSQKRVINYEKKEEFLFTQELARDLIKREIELPFSENSDYAEYEDISLVERRTIDVYVNGYPTHKPYGKQAKTVEIHSLSTVMATSTKEIFESILERSFHRLPVFFSNTFMNYQSLKTVLPNEDNVLMVDVSGRSTEVSVIKHDHLTHVGTFPAGTRNIVAELSKTLSFSFSKTQSLIEMSETEVLDSKYREGITSAMKSSFHVWQKSFYSFIEAISRDGILPSVICLSATPLLQNWLTEQLLGSKELMIHMHAGHSISVVDMSAVFAENKKNNIDVDDQNMLMIHAFIENIYGSKQKK